MQGTSLRWSAVFALVCLLPLQSIGADVPVVQVTDRDRVFRNFTREAATVGSGNFRLEVRGMHIEDNDRTRLDLSGFPNDELEVVVDENGVPIGNNEVDRVNGGIIDLLGSYGFGDGEAGFIVPFLVQETEFEDGSKITDEDVGDVSLYGKWTFQVAENCKVAGGVDLTVPTGPESEGLGTGEFSANPFLASRYQKGRFSLGAHVGYQIFTGGVDDVLNYSVSAIVRPNSMYAIRLELSGRWFETDDPTLPFDTEFHDVVFYPGIDFNLADWFTIRPTGLANVTDEALDWGVGLGLAVEL